MQLEEEVFHLYVTKNMKDSRRIRLKSLLPQFICLNCVRRRWKKVESVLEWFFPLCSSVSAPRISWKFLFLDSNTQKTLQMMSQERLRPPHCAVASWEMCPATGRCGLGSRSSPMMMMMENWGSAKTFRQRKLFTGVIISAKCQ